MPQDTSQSIREDSPAVRAHLTIEQSVIQRMAGNSASCKSWCVTLVSAILVVIADKDKPALAYLGVLPTLVFFVLDAYYLGLERMFRNSNMDFLKKLHEKRIMPDDLFIIKPIGDQTRILLESMLSFSVLHFYGGLLLTILMIKWIVI